MNKYLAAFLFFISVSFAPCFAQQKFGGIGAQLFLDTMGGFTMPCIQGFLAHSSAEQYLRVTDFIIKVNDISCRDKSMQDVVGIIRGEVGTTVKITVADSKLGKNPREYDLIRGAITTTSPPGTPTTSDPVAIFSTICENEVAQLKKDGNTIIKTFPSECGSFFFNFDADAQAYHIRVLTIVEKSNDASAFNITARVFDNANETTATQITKYEVKEAGNFNIGRLDGMATFNKPCIGAVNVLLHDDTKKCRAMYVVIYK